MSLSEVKSQGARRDEVHWTGWALALQSHYVGGLTQVTCSKLQKSLGTEDARTVTPSF